MPSIKQMAEQMKNSLNYNFSANLKLINDPISSMEICNGGRLRLAREVASWLGSMNRYALELDKLPYGEDAVEYFLNTSKEGYCVHFASAGTLRYLSI